MFWPIVIHKDRKTDYGVTVPDLPGCFSAGRTMEEALACAREAIELHLEGLMEEGMAVPRPSSIDRWRGEAEYRDGTWAVVSATPGEGAKAKRINITLPARVLETVDRFANAEGQSRSGLLAQAALEYVKNRSAPAPRRRRRRAG